jgi:glycosyltransferase involved in cell wall biosynthesis
VRGFVGLYRDFWINATSISGPGFRQAFVSISSSPTAHHEPHQEKPANDIKSRMIPSHLLYMAPFLSGGGYSSEALTIAIGLHRYYPNLKMQVIQHGDSTNDAFLRSAGHVLYRNIQDLYRKPQIFPPQDGNWTKLLPIICHSEPGAWSPALYQTIECPPTKHLPPHMPLPGTTKLYLIGRTMFETDGIPNGWAKRLNAMDEVWVPTAWNRETFIAHGVDPKKIQIVGEPVDVDFYSPSVEPLFLSNTRTKFLSVFKWETRKGWNILLEAFFKEFQQDESVELHIVTAPFHPDTKKSFQQSIREFSDLHFPNVTNLPKVMLRTDVSTPDMPRLYKSVDCLVIPSRGEGWGRPHVEAMSMELPVIASNWSGNTEFMKEKNSFLLPINGLVAVQDGAWKDSGMKWADPSTEELRKLLRFVYENPGVAKGRGIIARQDMIEKYHPKVISELIFHHLERIYNPK